MKQDRFLTGILIGIAVIVVVALAVFLTRKDNLDYVNDDTPEGAIQNYIVALHKRNFEKAYGYLADLPNKPAYSKFQEAFLNHSIDPSNTGVEIGTTEITGNTATVSLGMIYSPNDPFSSGYRNAEFALLVKQEGLWKIKQLPYNFWNWDWYQPETQKQEP